MWSLPTGLWLEWPLVLSGPGKKHSCKGVTSGGLGKRGVNVRQTLSKEPLLLTEVHLKVNMQIQSGPAGAPGWELRPPPRQLLPVLALAPLYHGITLQLPLRVSQQASPTLPRASSPTIEVLFELGSTVSDARVTASPGQAAASIHTLCSAPASAQPELTQ